MTHNELKNRVSNIVRPIFPKLEEISKEFSQVLQTGNATNQAKYVTEFEKKIAEYIGVKYCAVFNSGEQALISMLKAANLKYEVITTAYSFCGTAHAIAWNNLTPVFADIEESTWTIDPNKVEELITNKTSAILAAPLFGNPCDNYKLQEIAHKHRIKLFFDSASGFGCKYDGRMIGSFGEAEIFSFHATKVFPTMEGGALVTNNKNIYDKVCSLRNFGKNYRGADCDYIGFNGKMTEICAIIGLNLLKKLDSVISYRNKIAQRYEDNLKHLSGIEFQVVQNKSISSWLFFQFEVVLEKTGFSSDELMSKLNDKNIPARKFNFPANHQLTCYKYLGKKYLPIAERIAANSVALPVYSDMIEEEVDYICEIVSNCWKELLNNKSKGYKND